VVLDCSRSLSVPADGVRLRQKTWMRATNRRAAWGLSLLDQRPFQPLLAGGRRAKGIAWLEVVGGLVGCVSIAWYQLSISHTIQQLELQLLPFGLLVSAGIALLRSKRTGLVGSIIMQAVQGVAWHAGQTTWRFCAGPFVSLTLFSEKTSFYAGWESSIAWGTDLKQAPRFVSFNLVSCALAYLLWREVGRGRKGAV
jgi:hypothetical protein